MVVSTDDQGRVTYEASVREAKKLNGISMGCRPWDQLTDEIRSRFRRVEAEIVAATPCRQPTTILRHIATDELHVFASDAGAEEWRRTVQAPWGPGATERMDFTWHASAPPVPAG